MKLGSGGFRLPLIAAVSLAAAGLAAAAAGCSNPAPSAGPAAGPSRPRTTAASASRSPGPGPASTAPASPGTATSRPASTPPHSSGSGGTVAVRYRRYANPRFGFSALRPASFRAQAPPADGDGQSWSSPDGQATVGAFGINNIPGYSPGQDEAAVAQTMTVTYHAITGNVVTVSGYADGGRTIIYQRDVVGPGAIDTLYWKYPASQKARWNAAVVATAQGFRPGDLSSAH